ncbi:MAG TPA: ABC transporter permease [Candidatus Flavonifractor intestinipullorum]|uniref:ABC transporter permease n=1 Tax=Candidatus Flavonifractor intestinipullorum TaxID=2838587 RepID=A0A9D2M969_9FIRM|nr:ABC transporter permease [Candidatus Flavonifractor intestinipullorum]
MLSYVLKRILSLIPVLFVVSVVIFLVIYLIPGGPATALLGLEASAEQIEQLNTELGFNRPFLVQYADWLSGVFHGDWGESFFLQQSVLDCIAQYFGPTLSLAILAQIFAVILSIPLGILAAYYRGSAVDLATVSVSLLGIAVPGFLLSMFLMLFFGVFLQLLPVAGYAPLSQGLWEHLRYLILPALSLGLVQAAYITRMTRSAVLDVLYSNFIRTARAKGLRESAVVFRYALKNAGPTILTVIGQSFGGLVTGTIVTETIFNIPGLGMLTMTSINRRDVFVIQGVVLFVTLIYVLVNLVVDILYGLVDPRIQLGRK